MKRILVVMVLAALGATSVAGCGEREQSALYKDGKYRGKPDSRSWDNEPPAGGTAVWAKGDRAGWENRVRSRSGGQNENRRIGH